MTERPIAPRGWHPEDIVAAIRKTGVTLAQLARRYGLDRTTISAAIRRPQPAGQDAIADYLGMSTHELWPQFYDAEGALLPSAAKATRIGAPAQRQRGEAA